MCFPISLIPNELEEYRGEKFIPLSQYKSWTSAFLNGIKNSKFEQRLENIFDKLMEILTYTSSINKINWRIHKSMDFFWTWNGLLDFDINEEY
ncbi:hypothetical protein C4B24_02710 [Mycoplasma marinum]|uniref:Uncharacterized protein n=1 Tax=Mycoplasma marinum TaxID=1937190 RepID=A0A4R0XRX9_9MOLU|nr:hypothetical protein C4B24_02710 [Mycoplasma marinum]